MTEKSRESSGGKLGGHWMWGQRENFFEFSSKKLQMFMHFYCEKLYFWPETGTGGA